MSFGCRLVANAIGNRDVNPVRHGVRALNDFPRRMLAVAILSLLARMPTNGSRIKKNLRARQRRQPRAFGIPLIPTDQRADFAVIRVEGSETKIARREIELLV